MGTRTVRILFLLFCLLESTVNLSAHSAFYTKGVSFELAQWRKQTIKNLKYNLSFSIPEQKSLPVDGKVTICFTLTEPEEIIIDFRESADKVKQVRVNGKVAPYRFENEHLILSKSTVAKGANTIAIDFIAGNQSLNRNEDFLYTLLVPDRARTLFPCFDQPNLKAKFILKLEVPESWKAVSNTAQTHEKILENHRKKITFGTTEPLSTYLFSFVAGKLEHREYREGQQSIAAYYRETDPKKVAQLDTIFKQVMASLRWLENYTGIDYPFAKYDFIILPGFQYGGMEHTGATLYNDNQMFLSEHPTPDEELRRTLLIAHETAHMWFGDFVTMDWFNDVWTKEVFANYFAACITEPLFLTINHELNRLRTFNAAALSEDRTLGTTAIRQPLDNLNQAGLIYGQIIYNKAPIMMAKLVELMGKEAFQAGVREYLKTYAYSNATWDQLIDILDRKTPEDLTAFSEVWVNRKGMPTLTFKTQDGQLILTQHDRYHRGLIWPQTFQVTLCGDQERTVEVQIKSTETRLPLPFDVDHLIVNSDGRGYGLMIPDQHSLDWVVDHWTSLPSETNRQAQLMLLYENYLNKTLSNRDLLKALYKGLLLEKNALIASTIVQLFPLPLEELDKDQRVKAEEELMMLAESHPIPSCQTQLLRMLTATHISDNVSRQLYTLWKNQNDKRLNEQDYMTLSYELALRMPDQQDEIISTQRARLTNPDRLRQFDYIRRAIQADRAQQNELFLSLMKAENRRIEPWTASLLYYLNHPLRQAQAVHYIQQGLNVLEEVQRTGDIFFPRNWVSALLRGHRTPEAYSAVKTFLETHPNYPQLLKNKILQASYLLYRDFSATQ